MVARALIVFVLAPVAVPHARAAEAPARYFQLMKAELTPIEERLKAEPAVNLAGLESRPSARHFPSAVLAAAVLFARQHPANDAFGDKRWLTLALKIGDLLATENEKGEFQKRQDNDWDMYMWLEAYRVLEPNLGDERRTRWEARARNERQGGRGRFHSTHGFPPVSRTLHTHFAQPLLAVGVHGLPGGAACSTIKNGRTAGPR